MMLDLNRELIRTTKTFLRHVLSHMQLNELETAIALEELAVEIRRRKAAERAESRAG